MNKNKPKLILLSTVLIFSLCVFSFWPRHQLIDLALIDRNLIQQGYSVSEIQTFKEELNPDQVLSLSVFDYHPDALERFSLPHYIELRELGYTQTEARLLSQNDNEQLIKIMGFGHIDGILTWLQTKYLVLDRLLRYQAYALTQPSLSTRAIVERVNADRDYPAYTHVKPVDLDAPLLLVNKYHELPSTYVPDDLVAAQGCGTPTLIQEAAQAYELMCQEVTKAGFVMMQDNAYRSYAEQASLYASYLKSFGQTYADTVAARPGFSEHQTGLAVDLTAGEGSSGLFVTTKTYLWLIEHCTDYGFILRYPKGKEAVTGYRFESWHYRYVGVDTAKAIQESGLTLDEYALVFP